MTMNSFEVKLERILKWAKYNPYFNPKVFHGIQSNHEHRQEYTIQYTDSTGFTYKEKKAIHNVYYKYNINQLYD